MRQNNDWVRNPRFRSMLMLVFLLVTLFSFNSCKKDDEQEKPVVEYVLEYIVNPVGDLTVSEIVYTDSTGVDRILTGQRNLRLSFKSKSGFKAMLSAKGTFTNGGIFVSIQAYNLGGTAVNANTNDGFSGTGGASKPFALVLNATLP